MKTRILVGLLLLAFFLLLREKGSGPVVSQNGISLTQFAGDLMSKYDSNADGILDVTEESFLKTKTNKALKTESRGLLFTDADGFGNANGSVSGDELVAYLEEFDTDGDGELTTFKNIFNSIFGGKSEWAKFDDKYQERLKYDDV